jgi:hypothetical protein
MFDLKRLKELLKSIYKLDDKYLMPITNNWFLPDGNIADVTKTYIGYRIMSKRTISYDSVDNQRKSYIKISFRLSFIGKNAEQLSDQIHFWKDQEDILKILDSYHLKLDCSDMCSYTYPTQMLKYEMAWIFDLTVKADYLEELKLQEQSRNRKKLKHRFMSLLTDIIVCSNGNKRG